MFGQPLLVRTVPPRPTEQGQKLLALLRQVELLEEEWLGDEQTGSTPLLLSLAVNADSLATWLLPALANVLSDSLFVLTCRWKMKPAPRSACAVGKWWAQ
ncbi:Chromosome initiation inhibitor [Klebsiella aerogenes]|nr:Chromosome initiation inhibitor [Klebsiella aerogenes]